ncbi:MAG: pilus assembly protein N-terminal domain-containing protein [Immundisolibacterales bacterium]|nr:pilus assembly protein N-terminal domain-containing protein [Immundisolibacterales bacterium]
MIRTNKSSRAPVLPRVLLAAVVPLLAACAGAPAKNDAPEAGSLLRNSLPVAAAALAAEQFDVARRLYLSLAERFGDAPEPVLGLAYVALYSGNLDSARKYFIRTIDLAENNREIEAEAWLGAGRVALSRGDLADARRLLEEARGPAEGTRSAPWILNGLAVAAALDADYESAAAHYAEALRLAPANPRLTANYVRTLLGAERIDEAARIFAAHPPSWWKDEDGRTLARLIEEHRKRHADARERASVAPASAPKPPPALAAAPERPRAKALRAVAPRPRPPPPPSLDLKLSDFALSPGGPGPGATIARPDPSALVLRVADWPAPITPPALNGEIRFASYSPPAPAPASPVSPALPRPGSAAAATAGDPSRVDQAATGNESAALESPLELPLASPEHSPPEVLTLALGQSRRLHLGHEAMAVSIASPEIADVQLLSPSVLYVIGKGVGRTTIAVLVGDDWNEERIVSVTLDLEPLRAALAELSNLEAVRVKPLARGVVLSGEVASPEVADRALRTATTILPEGVPIENDLRIAGPQQVNLEVQIAEVSRSVTEELGVSWEAFQIRGQEVAGFRIGRIATPAIATPIPLGDRVQNPFPQFPLAQAAPWLELSTAPFGFAPAFLQRGDAASLAFGRQNASTRIGAMIDALATAGLANVLARPNVTAVSGESASFFSGGEYPVTTGYDRTTGVATITFRKYGVLLDFVPTVVDAGRIVLTVRPEVSEPSRNESVSVGGGVVVPVMNVRRAETTVEVGNGESIVIAGLFRNSSNTSESGVPGLKDVPLLGALFGTTSTRSNELELIVIVTARLVHANAAREDSGAPPADRQAGGYRY